MFQEIVYLGYDSINEYNSYQLYDSCFAAEIISPYKSPTLKYVKNRLGNTLTMLSIIKCYETRDLNVARNLAYYYLWMRDHKGYIINNAFIRDQLSLIDASFKNTKYMAKYHNGICQYLKCINY